MSSDLWVGDGYPYNDAMWIRGFNPQNCPAWSFVMFENGTYARLQCSNSVRLCKEEHPKPERYMELLTIKQEIPAPIAESINRPTQVFSWNPPVVPSARARVTKRQAKLLDELVEAPPFHDEPTAYESATGSYRREKHEPTPQVWGFIEVSPADREQRYMIRKALKRRRRYPPSRLPLKKVQCDPLHFVRQHIDRMAAAATMNMLIGLGIVA